MNTTKLLTVLVAALVVSAGAGAVTAVQDDADTSVDASYDDGTVTLTVSQNGTGVENVSAEANDEDVGTTDENGTLTFETNASEELELELEGEGVNLERTYAIENGDLVFDDEEDDQESEENETEDDETALDADVTYDNGTVDVTVTQNSSAVANATVEANDERVGSTDANGSLTFETNASEELELEIESGEQELELEYEIEDGELVRESNEEDDDADEAAGPSENASDRAHSVFAVVQSWLDGDREGSLGQLLQEELDNGNDDAPGNSGNASENGNDSEAPGNSGDAPGNSGDAPGNSDNAPGHDDGEDEEEIEEDNADEESEEEESEDEAEDDDDDHPGNGNGNN